MRQGRAPERCAPARGLSRQQTIAPATPVFFALIALEYLLGRPAAEQLPLERCGEQPEPGIMSRSSDSSHGCWWSASTPLSTRLLRCGICRRTSGGSGRWRSSATISLLLDHRIGHESAVFWASHVVHHQSQEYNLSTALRQTSSGALLGWIFYLPMAICGFPPQVFVVAAIVDLLYQYWIHTEQVGKLGWFDRWFASPSNHRVHHAVNDQYLDRNYGGIFMAWDRMFGTFVEEDEKCGTAPRPPSPGSASNLEVRGLARAWQAARRQACGGAARLAAPVAGALAEARSTSRAAFVPPMTRTHQRASHFAIALAGAAALVPDTPSFAQLAPQRRDPCGARITAP
jgi:hypothetical protein